MNKNRLFFCFALHFQLVYSQTINLEVPLKAQAQINHEFVLNLNIAGIRKYKIRVEGSPAAAIFQNNKFKWTPTSRDARNYLLKFYLQDSVGSTLSEKDLDLSVDLTGVSPSIKFNRSFMDTIQVIEGESFSLSATIKSGKGSDPKSLTTYFLFNENPDLRSFDSCFVNRLGDQILFHWTPSNAEALKEYANLRITVIDEDNTVLSRMLNFKIKNINRSPSFEQEIPDTVFIANGDQILDFSAKDPDHDKLKYDYTPKSPLFYWQDHKIILKQEYPNSDYDYKYPIHLSVSAADGEYSIRKTVCIMRNQHNHQLSIGDFSRKLFFEGDLIVTFLNLSSDGDPKNYTIRINDLALPPGIVGLTPNLIFEKNQSYLKIRSKGVLPYYLVDRDYTYNVAVSLSSNDANLKPLFKVLELTVKDRPDPTSIGHQKDSVLQLISSFLKFETLYKANLEKLYGSINRPWWKKVAVITGTLSGVLSLVQSQSPQKSISIISAGISLVSITVTNLPSLTEKPLLELNDKISSSKGRIEQIQTSETNFKTNWSTNIDRASFNKMEADIMERVSKLKKGRREDVCELLKNRAIKRRIEKLIKLSGNSAEFKSIFNCKSH